MSYPKSVYELLDLLTANGEQVPLAEIPEHLRPALSMARAEPCLVDVPYLGLMNDPTPRVYLTRAGRAERARHEELGRNQSVDGKPSAEELPPESRPPAKVAPTKRRGGRPKKTEKDSATKVVAALSAHHGYESGSVTNYVPATNRGLAERFGVSKNALTRFLKDRFPNEEYPFKKYKVACRNKTIGTFLALWNGELPGHHADLMSHESGSEEG
jgi:hypothetical protein